MLREWKDMKNNMRKLIFIPILLILISSSFVYAYWTDKVNSRIDISLNYERYIDVLNVPQPVIPVPQQNKETEDENSEAGAEDNEDELDDSGKTEDELKDNEDIIKDGNLEDKENTGDGDAGNKDIIDKGAENELEYNEDKPEE